MDRKEQPKRLCKPERLKRVSPLIPDSPENIFKAMFRVADRKLERKLSAQGERNGK